MKFNYASRKREFINDWKHIRKICLAEGISAEDIAKAKAESWEDIKSDRRFAMHTASGVDYEAIIIDPISDYSHGGTKIAVEYDFYDGHSRYWWIENPRSDLLASRVRWLSDYEKELLTLKYVYGFTYQEMESILNVSDSTLSDQVQRLMSRLKR